VQQFDSRTELPQFDLSAWEPADPDRTLERLPALSSDRLPDYSSQSLLPTATSPGLSSTDVVTAPAAYAPVVSMPDDTDMAATVELVPELSASDILEEEEVAPRAPLPPLVLPAPVSVPIDLDRLLARARKETSRSVEFLRPGSITPPPASVSSGSSAPPSSGQLITQVPESTPFALTESMRTAEPLPLVIPLPLRRSRLGWVVGTLGAVAAVSVGIALGQARVSAAQSPTATPANPVAVAPKAPAPAPQPHTTAVTGFGAPAPGAPPVTSDLPTVAVQSLPRVQSGAISLAAVAATHRLFIDGRVAAGGSAVVTCGPHLVQVGSRGQKRTIDVPCGTEIVLDR
jgi:hypothetical protein